MRKQCLCGAITSARTPFLFLLITTSAFTEILHHDRLKPLVEEDVDDEVDG